MLSLRPIQAILTTCLLAVAATASAQAFPDKTKPIKIIVPFAAGGGVDLLARAYAKAMAEVAGLNVIVDNKPGAETVIGVQAFMASPPDGYTLMVASSSAITLAPVSVPNFPFDPVKDFLPVIGIGKSPFVVPLGPSTTFKTGREFIAAARANPGKYTCGSASASTRMACEYLQAAAGVKLLVVPYKAAGAAMTAVAAGEVDTYVTDPGSAKALWSAGRVRVVATTGLTRAPTMAQLPTMREEGVANYTMAAWFAAYMPAKTPPELVLAMRDVMQKASQTKVVTDLLTSSGVEPLGVADTEITAMTKSEIDQWNNLIRTANIKLN